MLDDNELLNIELRNRGNEDVETLVRELRFEHQELERFTRRPSD